MGGSGLASFKNSLDIVFIFRKLSLWRHIGIEPYLFAWLLIFSLFFIHKKKTFLFWNVLFSTIIFFLWFGFASPLGWFRHIFPGVFMGMILISVSLSDLAHRFLQTKQPLQIFIFFLFLLYIIFEMSKNQRAISNFFITKKQALSLFWQKPPNGLQGPLSHPIFSKKDQDEVAKAIEFQINTSKRLCFNGGLLVAEIPPLVDRVFFPLERCKNDDILIIGPYQKGPFTLLKPGQLSSILTKNCKKILFNNDSYTLCSIKKM